MSASSIVQLLLLLDQVTAQVINILKSVKDLSKEDEDVLQKLLVVHRDKNNAVFASVMESLKSK